MKTFFCPVCRAPSQKILKDQIGLKDHAKILLTVVFVCTVAYQVSGALLAIKLALIYLPLWGASEALLWLKMRNAIRCGVCGFDPVLYQQDWKEARNQVEKRLQNVVDDLKKRIDDERLKVQNQTAAAKKPSVPAKPSVEP